MRKAISRRLLLFQTRAVAGSTTREQNTTTMALFRSKTTTSIVRNSVNWPPLHAALLIPFVLVWLAISPTARTVTPAPDGGYPNENTAEGDDALFSLTTGLDNT